jgi:hypothetical protein
MPVTTTSLLPAHRRIGATEPGAGRTNPAQFLRAGQEFERHGAVGGISGLDVGKSTLGIGGCFRDSIRTVR